MADEQVVAAGDVTEQVNAEETVVANPEGGDTDPQANANEGEPREHKRKGGWQRQIEKRDRQIETLIEQLAATRGGSQSPTPPTQPAAKTEPSAKFVYEKPEPNPADFLIEGTNDVDVFKYSRACARWELDSDKAESAFKDQQAKKADADKSAANKRNDELNAWRTRNAEAMKSYKDYEEAIGSSDISLSNPMTVAIEESDSGAHLAYYFATHEDEAIEISKMSPFKAAKAIAAIEAQFAPQDEGDEKEEQVKAPTAPITRAPAPATPVNRSASSARPFNPLDSSTYKDYADYEKKMTKWEKDRKAH